MTTKDKWAFLFPGQGAQYVGMGRDFHDAFSLVRETFSEADDLLSFHLSRLILEGPAEELTLTKNSQLAIFTMSFALFRVLRQQLPSLTPDVCAGLSLGEYTALVAAERLQFDECLRLVQARALFMHQACETQKGTMRVVLGMEAEEVDNVLAPVRTHHQVGIANLNCPGQVVIAGSLAGIDAVTELLKEKGAKRVLPLEVSGAFHSPLMAEAQTRLTPLIEMANLQESQIALVMNIPGDYVSSLAGVRENLIQQVTGTVRWEKGIRAISEVGNHRFLEIGCGKTLSGMNKKIGVPQESIMNLEKVTDLEAIAKAYEALCNC